MIVLVKFHTIISQLYDSTSALLLTHTFLHAEGKSSLNWQSTGFKLYANEGGLTDPVLN